MKSKLVHFFTVGLCAFSLTALAQTSSAASNPPAASGSTAAAGTVGGAKIATIGLEQAVGATNEGQRDLEELYKRLEPKQTEIKAQNDELDSLKKQLQTQGDKLNDESHADLVRRIDTKQKAFDRAAQDFRDDANAQQQEILQRILGKMAPVIQKYLKDNGYGLVLESKPWPEGLVIMTTDAFDITKPIVDAYNVQSGVAAPTAPATARPSGTRPSGTAKPATPAAK